MVFRSSHLILMAASDRPFFSPKIQNGWWFYTPISKKEFVIVLSLSSMGLIFFYPPREVAVIFISHFQFLQYDSRFSFLSHRTFIWHNLYEYLWLLHHELYINKTSINDLNLRWIRRKRMESSCRSCDSEFWQDSSPGSLLFCIKSSN